MVPLPSGMHGVPLGSPELREALFIAGQAIVDVRNPGVPYTL